MTTKSFTDEMDSALKNLIDAHERLRADNERLRQELADAKKQSKLDHDKYTESAGQYSRILVDERTTYRELVKEVEGLRQELAAAKEEVYDLTGWVGELLDWRDAVISVSKTGQPVDRPVR